MALVNVRRDVSDAFYRYKMEKIQTKIEGKGNGIKTVVVNLSSVANSLARPGSYVIKYFGFELGAQTNIDPRDDRWIINGAHEAVKLQELLDGFINKFVLCKKCKNPETDVVIKDERIVLDCKACGQRSDVDLRLKLSSFILKNQPKKGKKDKAERRAAKKAKQQQQQNGGKHPDSADGSGAEENGGSDNGSNDNDDGDAAAFSDNEFEQVKAVVEEISAATGDGNEDKEEEWALDMSAEAVKARQQQAQISLELQQKLKLSSGAGANGSGHAFANGGGFDEDDEEGGASGPTAYDELGEWILQEAQTKGDGNLDKVDSIDVYVKAKELGIESKHRTMLVLGQALFNESVLTQLPKRAPLLKQLIGDSEKHEKALLGGIERLMEQLISKNPEFLPNIVKILQILYMRDVLSEEVVTKWGTKASKKYVDLPTSKKIRKAAEPFLRWLEEAESEEDDDEDDE